MLSHSLTGTLAHIWLGRMKEGRFKGGSKRDRHVDYQGTLWISKFGHLSHSLFQLLCVCVYQKQRKSPLRISHFLLCINIKDLKISFFLN